MMKQVIIIGGGQAGCQAASSLREAGYEGRIVIISKEQHLPYQRPPLSKGFLKDGNAQALLLRSHDWFDENQIDIRLNTCAESINRQKMQVHCTDNSTFDYDFLILATGVRSARPPISGLAEANTLELRSLSDAQSLRESLDGAKKLAIIGAGFIGLEVASFARSINLPVTVVEAENRVMARAVSEPISELALSLHIRDGVDFHLETFATAISVDQESGLSTIQLSESSELNADCVLVATGAIANSELATAAGLVVNQGIVVDETLRTSDENIFAIGDCARTPLADYSSSTIRLESVQAATDHARYVANQIVSESNTPYSELPWFWSDQNGFRLQIVGLVSEARRFITIEKGDNKWVVCGFLDEVLVSVETVNSSADHLVARRLLGPNNPILLSDLEAVDFDFRRLLQKKST